MAAEDRPPREAGETTLDVTEFQALLRGEEAGAPEPGTDGVTTTEIRDPSVETREPEIITSEQQPELRPNTVVSAEQLRSALAAQQMERLSNEVVNLREQQRQVFSERPQQQQRQFKMVEVAPGLVVPENREEWAIRVTPQMLQSVNIDPSIADGINVLANAFYYYAVQSIGQGVVTTMDVQQNQRQTLENATRAFRGAFPDLNDKMDLVLNTQEMMRRAGRHLQGLSDAEYQGELATRTRARVAALRGVSLDNYMRDVQRQSVPQFQQPRRGNRARMGTGGGSFGRGGAPNANDRELQDMF